MADAADAAAEIADIHLAAALRQHRRQANAPPSTGLCAVCGEAIAPARLAALPSARTCITCAR
jgi:phage/conjugal plasmid C-4 type zinc finger TraR family protein